MVSRALVRRIVPGVALVAAASALHAQPSATTTSAPASDRAPRGWEFGAQFGVAPASRTDGWFGGQAAGISQVAVTLVATRDLVRAGPVALRYVAQLDPLVRMGGVEAAERLGGDESPLYVVGPRVNAYGVALVPLALGLEVRPSGRWRLAASGGVGVAGFSESIPLAAGRRRNFIAQGEAAALVRVGRARWLEGGLRWRHVSNGYTGWENPGVDSRLVFLGVRIGGR